MRVTTWNMLHGRSAQDGRIDPQRLRTAVARIDADVLGLQEVDRGQPRSAGRDLAAETADALGARHWRFVPALIGAPQVRWRPAVHGDAGREMGYGVALVSRYPVTSWHVLTMPAARIPAPVLSPGSRRPTWIADEPRVALAAVLRSPLGELTVVTTHLSFVPGQNLRQLHRVAGWLRALPWPQLLLGDLNLPLLLPGSRGGFAPLARAPTYPAGRPRIQLDHILYRGSIPLPHSSTALALPVSDHHALCAQW